MNRKKVTPLAGGDAVSPLAGGDLLASEAPATPDECAELVRAAAAGDTAALDQLIQKAQAVARRFSGSVCGHADDAEDAMQEALIRTYRHVARLRDPAAFRPWLYRTVRNACLMGRRRKVGEPARLQSLDAESPGREGPLQTDVASKDRSPEELAANVTLRRQIRAAMGRLPPSSREIVFLREMEGLSTREVAAVMGLSEANVKQRLHRARVKLQAALAEESRADDPVRAGRFDQ